MGLARLLAACIALSATGTGIAGIAGIACGATVDWSRQIHSTAEEQARGIARDSSGNLIVGGHTTGSLYPTGTGGGFVAKYDSTGAQLWASQFTANYIMSVAADSGGNVAAVGAIGSDLILRRFDPNGGVLWTQQFGSATGSDQANGITTDSAGNIYVSGRFDTLSSTQDAFLAKYSAAGVQQWVRRFGTSGGDYATGVKIDPSGNVVVAGSTSGNLAGQVGSYDAFVRKYDPDGNVIWTRQLGSTNADNVNGVAVDGTGNIFVVGTGTGIINGVTPPMSDVDHGFLIKLAGDGTFAWAQQILGGSASAELFANDVSVDNASNAYVSGAAFHGTTNDDFFICSHDPLGNVRWTNQFADINQTDEWFYGVVADPSGLKVWASGSTTGSFNGSPSAQGADDAVLVSFNVPEPASALLACAGAAARLLTRRRRR